MLNKFPRTILLLISPSQAPTASIIVMACPSAKRQRCAEVVVDRDDVETIKDSESEAEQQQPDQQPEPAQELTDSQPEDTLNPMFKQILSNFLNNNLNFVTNEGNGPVWERYFSLRRSLEEMDKESKEQDSLDFKGDAKSSHESQ